MTNDTDKHAHEGEDRDISGNCWRIYLVDRTIFCHHYPATRSVFSLPSEEFKTVIAGL